MKKLLIVSAIACSICGCNPNTDHSKEIEGEVNYSCKHFEYNGHVYIRFEETSPTMRFHTRMSVVHDPDCNCFHNNVSKGIIESKIFNPSKSEKK